MLPEYEGSEESGTTSEDVTTPEDPAARPPDEDAGPAVQPVEGDQGEPVEQDAPGATASATGFDPSRPVATSPPPAEAQSGVPQTPENVEAGVEPQPEYAGPVDPAQAPPHPEASTTDNPPQGADEGDDE